MVPIALIIQLCYGIPMLVLYVVVLFVLLRPKYRQFYAHSFYRLFAILCMIVSLDLI